VKEIRDRFITERISKRELARQYGVSDTNIGYIIKGTQWAHVRL
jgi:hypothetical protein